MPPALDDRSYVLRRTEGTFYLLAYVSYVENRTAIAHQQFYARKATRACFQREYTVEP